VTEIGYVEFLLFIWIVFKVTIFRPTLESTQPPNRYQELFFLSMKLATYFFCCRVYECKELYLYSPT